MSKSKYIYRTYDNSSIDGIKKEDDDILTQLDQEIKKREELARTSLLNPLSLGSEFKLNAFCFCWQQFFL